MNLYLYGAVLNKELINVLKTYSLKIFDDN
jgi:hypothetical protein